MPTNIAASSARGGWWPMADGTPRPPSRYHPGGEGLAVVDRNRRAHPDPGRDLDVLRMAPLDQLAAGHAGAQGLRDLRLELAERGDRGTRLAGRIAREMAQDRP